MKAIKVMEGLARVDEGECIGCGLCASHCPSGAVSMRTREEWKEPAADLAELGMTILRERGKL